MKAGCFYWTAGAQGAHILHHGERANQWPVMFPRHLSACSASSREVAPATFLEAA